MRSLRWRDTRGCDWPRMATSSLTVSSASLEQAEDPQPRLLAGRLEAGEQGGKGRRRRVGREAIFRHKDMFMSKARLAQGQNVGRRELACVPLTSKRRRQRHSLRLSTRRAACGLRSSHLTSRAKFSAARRSGLLRIRLSSSASRRQAPDGSAVRPRLSSSRRT